MAVYLIHLDTPLKHARHYVGFSVHVEARLAHHKDGTGARFLQVCNERGINYDIVKVWPGADRKFERKLKNTHNVARYCPICNKHPRKYHPEKEDPL